jgi:asparagine synthase (glutamine-hydrolysing)
MSGFFGMVRFDGEPVRESLLKEIAEELRFRGPEGVSIWFDGSIGGCFAKMRTGPAKQAETQPVFAGERFRLWGDIRLDGREELRQRLAEKSCRLSEDASSEEYLLEAWQTWGPGALERIIGDFSLALWDASERTLWCARDFFGGRPFYYSHKGSVFCFSNTLDVLRRVPGISDQLDEAYVGDFLLEGWNPEPSRTIYRDIRRLPAGHVLEFSNGRLGVRRFLKLPIEEPLRFKQPEEYVENYLDLLKAAVKDRMLEGPTGLYLSGGMDSSTVCAIASKIAGEGGQKELLKAFTVSWEPHVDHAEPAIAKLTARHLGLAHDVFQEAEIVPFEESDPGEAHTPEPNPDPFLGMERRHFRRIAAHSRVVLGGDGGDDVLTGQSWPYLVHLWKRGEWSQMAGDFGGYFLAHGRVPPLRGGFRTKLISLLKREDPFGDYPSWLNEDYEARANLKQRWTELRDTSVDSEHPFHPQAYASLHGEYWGDVLEAEDIAWTRATVETRSPLLDLRVLRFSLRLPPVPWCVDKKLSRTAMQGWLPPAVLTRPKSPFPVNTLNTLDIWYSRKRISGTTEVVPAVLKGFVNWEKWCETFYGSKGSLSWLNLRPLSLLTWSKAVENAKGIK